VGDVDADFAPHTHTAGAPARGREFQRPGGWGAVRRGEPDTEPLPQSMRLYLKHNSQGRLVLV
jgi:hypothetical protein